MKRIIAGLLSLALVLTVCGCAAQKAPAQADEKEIDVVLDWYPNALHAFIYTAIEKGYYADEGIKVNVRFPANDNDAIALVAAGKAEVGLYYQQDVIIAAANQGVPVKSLGAVVQTPLNIVLSLEEKNILNPADLVGKTIGYGGTELSEALIGSMMKNVGADSSDVTLINVGFDLMSSMTTGNVDATIGCLVNHEVPQLMEEGFAVNWFELYEYGVPNYYEGVFLTGEETLQNDSDALAAFLRASKKGFDYMKQNPEEALSILLNNQNAENFPLSETVERQSMRALLPLMETNSAAFLSQSDEMWQQNIDWLFDEGLIKEKPAVADLTANLL